MKTKDFREIQVSSTLLVVIFLCVLILGVFIFLLGVSVGKKQVQITAANQVVAQQIQEPARDKPSSPAPGVTPSTTAGSQPGTGAESAAKPAPKTSAPSAKAPAKTPAPAAATGTYYIQVSAFTDRAQAAAEAEKFRKRGYPVVVADPRPSDTKSWYRVRVGGYPTREKAAEVLTKLNDTAKKKTDYRIVKD
jgi:cell division septation protein DedD